MKDEKKTKAELIAELKRLRQKIARLDRSASKVEVGVSKRGSGRDSVVRMEIATDITDRKKIEEKLIESEELFRSIIETEPECVKMLDRQGRLLMMNPSGLRMIEAESAEMVQGQPIYGLIDPEYREPFGNMVKAVFKGKESKLVFRMTGLKGRSLWLDTISAPLRDETGKVTALLGVTRDITEQKKMEESLKESASILRESQEIGRIGSYVLDILKGTWESSEVLDKIFGIGTGKRPCGIISCITSLVRRDPLIRNTR